MQQHTFLNLDPQKKYRIIFWLIEKEIKALQLDCEGYASNYYSHHDVLKKALNGLDGQAHQIGTTISAKLDLSRSDEDRYITYTDFDDCYIMAILADKKTVKYLGVAKDDLRASVATGIARIK